MKICVAGLGAVGGLLAARLAMSGADVRGLARGATLAAVRDRGLTLVETDGRCHVVPLPVSDSPTELGPADLLVIAFKAQALAALQIIDVVRCKRPAGQVGEPLVRRANDRAKFRMIQRCGHHGFTFQPASQQAFLSSCTSPASGV